MKKNLLMLLGVAVMFFSCQNESAEAEEEQRSLAEIELEAEAEILVSDGEEDTSLVLNEESEVLFTKENQNQGLSFSMASKSQTDNCEADLDGFVASLPATVNATTTSKRGPEAYFSLDIEDTNLAETGLGAYCIDPYLSLDVEGPLEFAVYSSYGTIPDGTVDFPENLDLVNWILNQDYVGKYSPNESGQYTYGHVQWAIWQLLDDNNCVTCANLTNPVGNWNSPVMTDTERGQEIVDAALANGEGYVPGCGEKIGLILIPAGKQPIIVMKDVPEKEEECDDCKGDVDELTLEFDWCRSKRVRVYQKYENTCYGKKIFDKVLAPGEEFTLEGINADGSFGKYIYIYIGNCYYTKIKTNCYLNIGPGYERGVFNVVSGTSTDGGELCEYVKPEPKCYRHWSCYRYYNSCRYK